MLGDRIVDIAALAAELQISEAYLQYLTYGRGRRYKSIKIKKRRGGSRSIDQPSEKLKFVQRSLLRILKSSYRPRSCVVGFVDGQSIARNAQRHAASRWVLNVDLKDFFPSIHFGRVRGMFMASPYRVPAEAATVMAQLCCNKAGILPQGAPTSPIVSNMVCERLDSQLLRLARRHGVTYTRFVDDLTFSTNRPTYPRGIGRSETNDGVGLAEVGDSLADVINSNGFEVNHDKVRLQPASQRQEVTGLTVNEFPNVRRDFIRRIRAMLHAWKIYKHDAAEAHFLDRYDRKHRGPYGDVRFGAVVKGHIDFLGMVRGLDNRHYRSFLEEYSHLSGRSVRPLKLTKSNHIVTYRDGIWVLESEDENIQGTAFEIGEGLALTCAHVVEDLLSGKRYGRLTAFRPKRARLRVGVDVVASDRGLDIALVRLTSSGHAFRLSPRIMEVGHSVLAAGFPEHHAGSSLWELRGNVTERTHHLYSPRFSISQAIVAGASGSPVMDLRHRVVGMASSGVSSREAAARQDSVRFGVIPTDLILQFLKDNGIVLS